MQSYLHCILDEFGGALGREQLISKLDQHLGGCASHDGAKRADQAHQRGQESAIKETLENRWSEKIRWTETGAGIWVATEVINLRVDRNVE